VSDPDTVDGWLRLAAQHEASARALAEIKQTGAQAVFHAGLAVECALKAYIMRSERLNGWPSRDSRPELYTHDIRELRAISGLGLNPKSPLAPAWHIFLQWDRGQAYDPRPTPRKVARAYVEGAFGSEGLVTWIRQSCR